MPDSCILLQCKCGEYGQIEYDEWSSILRTWITYKTINKAEDHVYNYIEVMATRKCMQIFLVQTICDHNKTKISRTIDRFTNMNEFYQVVLQHNTYGLNNTDIYIINNWIDNSFLCIADALRIIRLDQNLNDNVTDTEEAKFNKECMQQILLGKYHKI
jgi:hypothetical protein